MKKSIDKQLDDKIVGKIDQTVLRTVRSILSEDLNAKAFKKNKKQKSKTLLLLLIVIKRQVQLAMKTQKDNQVMQNQYGSKLCGHEWPTVCNHAYQYGSKSSDSTCSNKWSNYVLYWRTIKRS